MKRSQMAAVPSLVRASKRANALIEAILKEMQSGLKQPERMASPEWERLFGAKQSMVVNVQKLVQALGALPAELPKMDSSVRTHQEEVLTPEEMKLLMQWLAESKT